jgi:DegV family protein with EDD domain
VTVRIVTDSAADIPPALAQQHGIAVVPLTIRFGDESFVSGVELSADAFWQKLKTSSDAPATAAPSAGDFQEAFEKLFADGATGIVSIHLSSKLSATYQSAVVAAQEMGAGRVEVVDSLAVSGGQGLLVLHAAERAAGGASASEIAAEVTGMLDSVRLFGAIDTLEYLRRGGRIGGAQALLGTMLKVKPVVSLDDGIVEPVARVRTHAKALEHIAGLVAADKERLGPLVVLNGDASDTDRFLSMLSGSVTVPPSDVWTLGPIVGAHAGPGILGVAYLVDGTSAPGGLGGSGVSPEGSAPA